MPSTVASVFAGAGLKPAGTVRWRTPVPEGGPGVNVVALTDDLRATTAVVPAALSTAARWSAAFRGPEARRAPVVIVF